MNNKNLYKHNKKHVKLLNKDGYRQPFQLLLDDCFILKMNQYKKKFKHLTELFKHEPKLFFTKCAFKRYKALGNKFETDISDNCQLINCKHVDNIDILKCYKSIFKKGNKHNYILCTSSKEVFNEYVNSDNIPVLKFSKGLLKIYMKTDHIERYKGLPIEATEEELQRLKKIFEGDLNPEDDKIKHEEVDFDELEQSEHSTSEEE